MNAAMIEMAKAALNDVLPNGYELGELCNGFCFDCEINDSDCECGASVEVDGTRVQFKLRKQEE